MIAPALTGFLYDVWERDGHIHAPPVQPLTTVFVAKRMAELAAMFDIRKVAFDRYHIDYLTPELDDEGLRFLWYRTAVDLVNRQSQVCGCRTH